MIRSRRMWLGGKAALAASMLAMAGCGGADGVRVHLSLPLQGDFRALSQDAVLGARQALAERDGMAGGLQVELVVHDDALAATGNWDAGLVSANARKAIADERSVAYIGDANSGATAVAMPLLNEAGLLHVSPTSTYVGLTRSRGADKGEPERYRPSGTRTFGRIIPADHIQARALAELIDSEGVRRLHLLHDRDVYGRGLAELVAVAARRRGIAVTGTDGLDRRAGSFRGVGEKIRLAGADGVFFGGTAQSRAVQVLRDVNASAPKALLFGADAVALPNVAAEIGARAGARLRLTSPALPPDALPARGRKVLEAFARRHGRDPSPFVIYGYEAMSVVLDAIDRGADDAGAERAAVRRAFFDTHDRASALGRYSIDRNGDTTLRTYGAYRVRRGELAYDRALGQG